MTLWLGAVATYLYLPFCVYFGLARAMGPGHDVTPLAAASLGLGPLCASWLLTGLLSVFPDFGAGFYIGIVLVVFAIPAVWGLVARPPIPALSSFSGLARPYLAVVAALLLLLAVQAVVLPLNGNDPLEYALVAKVIAQSKSLAHYPLRQADPVTGLYAGSSHPLGYISLIVWTYLFSGGIFDGLSRSISPFYTLALVVLFLTGRREDRGLHGTLAALLLLGASLYFQTSAICHIDSLRLYAMYLSVFCLDRIPTDNLNRSGRGWLVLCGIAAGLSLFCHSIGLLTLPFLAGCWLARARRPLTRQVAVLAVIGLLAVGVGGWRYARNTLEYGSPVRDDEPVWSLPSIDYKAYNDRLKTITSPVERLVNGVLTPLTRYNGLTDNALTFFGFSFWLALGAVILTPREVGRDPMAIFCLVCLGLFFALALASVAVGSSLIIKNVRYFLTVLPFAAYLGAIPVIALARRAARFGRLGHGLAVCSLILALCGGTLALNGATFAFALPNLRFLAHSDLAYLEHAYGGEYFYPAGYQAVAWVREHTPPDTRILVFRKNEMAYYGGRRILADTDPALLPFYAAKDAATALRELRKLGVSLIFTPNYLPPTFTNSPAALLADDPRHCELVFDRKGYRIYRLLDSPPAETQGTRPLPMLDRWNTPATFVPSFFTEIFGPSGPFLSQNKSYGTPIRGDIIPVTSAGVYSGAGPLDQPPDAALTPAPITGGAAYRFGTMVEGTGWLKAYAVFYLKGGGLTWDVLYDGVPLGPITHLSRQVLAPKDAWQYRLLFISRPRDTLIVSRPRLECLDDPWKPAVEPKRPFLRTPLIPPSVPWRRSGGSLEVLQPQTKHGLALVQMRAS